MVIFSYLAFDLKIDFAYTLFVGSGTMVTYGLHRIIGAQKSVQFQNEGRFAIVKQYLSHIKIYTLLASLLAVISFFILLRSQQITLIFLSAISLLYTLPLFTKGKRLRDFAFIKIFLVSFVWALSTGGLVLFGENISVSKSLFYSLSLFFYIMAITLPFDVRDLAIDKELNVSTIPSWIGKKWSFRFSISLLVFASAIIFLMPFSMALTGGLLVTYFLSAILIFIIQNKEHDYWYSGFLDATMLVPFLTWLILG